ncbi:MAG: hypothetical protein RL670_1151 [Actinomycetota bacterium]|jgi:hypothetical protein
MQVRVGIRESARELVVETNQSAAELEKQLDDALNGASKILKLIDSKGLQYLVPAVAIAYLEIGSATERKVGFIG